MKNSTKHDIRVNSLQDVTVAYRLLLVREPDESAKQFYSKSIQSGITYEQLYLNIVESDEFKDRISEEEKLSYVDCGGYFVCVRESEIEVGRNIIRSGTWDTHVAGFISKTLRNGQTFIDIGANVGVMSFLGSKIVGSSGSVIAIEPNQYNCQLLYRGVLKNKTSNVQILPFAVSNRVGVFSLSGGKSNTFLSSNKNITDHVQLNQSIVIDKTLRNIKSIDLVKMDIEGHEPFALEGFRQLLNIHRPTTIIEFSPYCLRNHSNLEPFEFLESLYDLYDHISILEVSGSQQPFRSAEDLWKFWQKSHERIVEKEQQPEYQAYFDLIASFNS